MKHMVSI